MFNNEGVSSLVLTPLPLFLRVFRVRVFFFVARAGLGEFGSCDEGRCVFRTLKKKNEMKKGNEFQE